MTPTVTWTVIVPVKHTSRGKSRLGADPALARAIALDTLERIAAARSVDRIVLVTSDDALAAAARREISGARLDVVAEATTVGEPDTPTTQVPCVEHSLNDAVRVGLQTVDDGLVAVIHADLPALRPRDLDDALRLAADVPFGAVADDEGQGTVMLTAHTPDALRPSFGRGSFARHRHNGAAPLVAARSLRHDIDTAEQLAAARRAPDLSLGPRTAAASAPA